MEPNENDFIKKPDSSDDSEKEDIVSNTIEIDGIKIEYKKSYFEYPEQIQKETGILGYERKIINLEVLVSTFKNIIFQLKESGRPMDKWELDHWEKFVQKDIHNFNELKDYFKGEHSESFIARMWSDLLINPILIDLSAGKYPNQTFNHRLGADMPMEQAQKYHTYLKDDRFFLQKIFDIDRITESYSEKELGIPTKDRFRYYRKLENNFISTSGKVGSISLVQTFETDSNKEKIYAVGPEGLNTKYGNIWGGESNFLTSFGFSAEDPLYYEYLHSSLELYKKLYQEDPVTYLHPITNIVAQIIMSDENIRRLYAMRYQKGYLLSNEDREEADFNLKQYLNEKISQISKEIDIDFITDENVDKYIREKYHLGEQYRQNVTEHILDEINEPDLPIIINHDTVPQLRWGNAKYAHMYTSKGLNYIEIKHADHLPDKSE